MDKSRQYNKARERRLRAKYRKNLQTAVVICLVLGLAGGFVLGRVTAPKPHAQPVIAPTATPMVEEATQAPAEMPTAEPIAVPTVAATEEATVALPTAQPTAAPTPVPETTEVIVPFGSTQNLSVQVHSDGTIRKENDDLPYETLNFSLRVSRYLTTEYYQATYGATHQLRGTETGVEFELMLNDYRGGQALDPNKVLSVSLENAAGTSEMGYKLVDAEIVDTQKTLSVTTNVPAVLYKRFKFDASVGEMKYMVVTTVIDGTTHVYKFELGDPIRPTPEPATPAPTVFYATLAKGETSPAVETLQKRLIELGYLVIETPTDYYGDKTAQAVTKAQAAFGMAETGVADSAFQQKLFESAE